MIVEQVIREFMIAAVADSLKPKTITWYRYMLVKFQERYGRRELTSITASDCRQYLVDLRAQNYSNDSIYDFHRGLHRFWRWCEREYDIANPMKNIRFPKQPRPKDIKAVVLDDVVKMLTACDRSIEGRRNKAIIAMLFDTGCRASGICELKMTDLDMQHGTAYVFEKGDKPRQVMFTEMTALLLLQWLTVRDEKQEHVFYGRVGPLTPSGLFQLTRRVKRKAGVQGRANPHAFRHGLAKELLLSGLDLAAVSMILGHEDESMTAWVYGRYARSELTRAHGEHSPMQKIKLLLKNGPEGPSVN